jgi:DNA-binding SARP family transcriptional activator/tetratricopeptide (TPR) repeat protein
MRVNLIGPLTVRGDGTELAGSALGGARERRLLAILAAAQGDVVAKDVVIDRLWDDPPRDPSAAVDTSVSLLRRALGAGGAAVETRRPGYRLACPTDLAALDDLVAAGRWEEASALVRHELLAGEPATAWVDDQRRELARRRIEVDVAAARAAERRGDDATAAERYAAVVRRDVLREDAQRGLLASLARRGRTAEALRAYERCRRALREELGIDPDPETAALYERILAGRPPRADPVPDDERPAIGAVPFLGRASELVRLTAPVDGCVVRAVLGEPGIGKSRLLAEATARLGGARVLATKCFRLVSPVPYAVLTDLASDLPDAPVPGDGTDDAAVLGPEGAATRLAARWAGWLAGEPTTLVVDDLQWADEPSLAVLGLVLRRRPAHLTVLVAARDGDLDDGSPASKLLELAASLGVSETVPLGPLDADDIVAAGYPFESWERSGGHPLLFGELLRGGEDTDLASLVLGRARAAGADAVDLLRAAAVLDRPAPLPELARLAEVDIAQARQALSRLATRGLLVESGGCWGCRHDVVAELVRAELTSPARTAWHARALALLTAVADPAELAHHALAAGDRDASIRHSIAAGERALAAYANHEAVGHFDRARRTMDEAGVDAGTADDRRRRAVLGQARASIVLARTDEALGLLGLLPPAAGSDQVERLLVEADAHWAAWKPSRALPPAREALALARHLDDDALEERAHALVANPYGSLGELGRAREHIDAALAIADRHGRPPPAVVVYRLALVHHQTGHEDVALSHLDRCRRLARAQHDERTLVFERVVRSWVLGALGRYGEALTTLDDIDRIGRGEEAVVRSRVPNTRASLLFDLGLIDMALEADEESLDIVRSHGGAAVTEPQIHTLLNLATDHLHRGDADRAAAQLAEAEQLSVDAEYARFRYMNRLHWVRGLLALEGGDVAAALDAASDVESLARRHDAPKYRVRARLLRGTARVRRTSEVPTGVSDLRAAARLAERHGFAALAAQAHRATAEATGSAHHARRADRWRARIERSVDGPLRDRLR